MSEKVSGWLNSHMRSGDLVIFTLKKNPDGKNFNPYRLGMAVRPLLNGTLFNIRLISA
jgi:hypothetical protein